MRNIFRTIATIGFGFTSGNCLMKSIRYEDTYAIVGFSLVIVFFFMYM